MFSTRLLLSASLLAFSTAGAAATKPEAKPAAKAEAKPAPKGEAKPKVAATPAPRKLRGKQETLACRLGTEDRHARIAVVTIGGVVDSFAYYSKWKPRTCSIYLQRGRDMYSKWADAGAITTVNLEKGAFLVEHKKGEYHFIFRDIDRERYCGMDGVINGSLTIRKGSEACVLDGEIMVEGTPLGQAFVNRDEDKPPPGMMPGVPSAKEEAAAPAAPAEQPAQPDARTTAPADKPATAAAPQQPAQSPAESAKAEAPAQKPGAPAGKPAEKAAESGGVRSFFRSFSNSRPAQTPATGQSE